MKPHNEKKAAAGRAGKSRSPWRHGYAPWGNRISDGPYCPLADKPRLKTRRK